MKLIKSNQITKKINLKCTFALGISIITWNIYCNLQKIMTSWPLFYPFAACGLLSICHGPKGATWPTLGNPVLNYVFIFCSIKDSFNLCNLFLTKIDLKTFIF